MKKKGKVHRLFVGEDLYKAIEQHASQRGQTVDQWVEEAVRHEMETLKRETGS
jgi:predicted HicB family RNase H-like nuclease